MELPELNKNTQSIARLGSVVLFLAAVTIGFMGHSVKEINHEIKVLEEYMEQAEMVQPNFESSLRIYTENTEDAIKYVHDLRPDNELEYIDFISELEAISHRLGINMNLSSDELESGVDKTGSNSLVYHLNFFASYEQLQDLMIALESLDYYLRFDDLDYAALNSLVEEDLKRPNVSLTLRLYVE